MGHDISIKDPVEDKKSWYNLKKFKIGNTDFSKPEKSLDSRHITQDTYDTMKLKDNLKFSEASLIFSNYSDIDSICNEEDKSKINGRFCKRNWLDNDLSSIVNLTFEFNPFKKMTKIEDMSDFFDLYYPYSKLFVTVPNIRTTRKTSKPYNVEVIIDVKGYTKFVDEAYRILNTKNNKPIFVPVSLRMSQRSIGELVNHYLKKEYYYYWFDFEGDAIDEVTVGRINHFLRIVKNTGYFKKIICHFTNMKREIISNPKKSNSPASDVLASIAGANIIGINREPRRVIKAGVEVPPPEHKARLLDADSYYYIQTKNKSLYPKSKYVPHNALRLQREFERQATHFGKEYNFEKYLVKKDMLADYKNGAILKDLTSKSPDSENMTNWL